MSSRAEMLLDSCAYGLTAAVQAFAGTEDTYEDTEAARSALQSAALGYAASCGDLAASERAWLATLRAFRDGVVSLRQELTVCSDLNLVKETIDALIAMSFPMEMK